MEIIEALESILVIANDGNKNVDKDIAICVLIYADISYAFDAGLLFFESTFLTKLDITDKARVNANEFLMNNWKRLPYNGRNMKDERYKDARDKLAKYNKKLNGKRRSSKRNSSKALKIKQEDLNVNNNDDEKEKVENTKGE